MVPAGIYQGYPTFSIDAFASTFYLFCEPSGPAWFIAEQVGGNPDDNFQKAGIDPVGVYSANGQYLGSPSIAVTP